MSHYLRDILWTEREELKVTHYEISPREREDEERRDEYDFGVQEIADEEQQDRIRRSSETPSPQSGE